MTLHAGVRLITGDCVEAMAEMDPESIDAVVTDPPYELNFMSKGWDNAGVSFDPATWAAAYRVLKPGGHLLAFGGTRTVHRIAVAIEDAGFEVRDMLAWMFGQGFPKSLNVGCQCDNWRRGDSTAQAEHDVRSMPYSDLSQAVGDEAERDEVLLESLSESCVSAIGSVPSEGPSRGEERLVEGRRDVQAPEGELRADSVRESAGVVAADGEEGRLHLGASSGDGDDYRSAAPPLGGGASPRPRDAEQRSDEPGVVADERRSQAVGGWPLCPRCGKPTDGLGTALKPAFEPIVVARKPLSGIVSANVLAHGTGALNIDGCRVEFSGDADEQESKGKNQHADFGTEPGGNAVYGDYSMVPRENYDPPGRWPANVILDECAGEMLDEQSGERAPGSHPAMRSGRGEEKTYGSGWSSGTEGDRRPTEAGGASRFFYCAKTGRAERNAGLDGFEERVAKDDVRMNGGGDLHHASGSLKQTPNRHSPQRNLHPTVKPIDLMRWLIRLVTPPGGTILDPFLGSGTTGCAAALEGFDFVGVEREPDYMAIAEARIAFWTEHGEDGLRICAERDAAGRERQAILDAGQLDLFAVDG